MTKDQATRGTIPYQPNMKALVLGGCGFVGSHIVDALLEAGHFVRVLDHSPEKSRPPLPCVDYRHSDFSDKSALITALNNIDVVFHTISTTVPELSNISPEVDIQMNLVNTVRLLEAMRDAEIKRIVFISSGGTVYGNPINTPIPETHPLNPICSYGIVKVAIEKYLYMYQKLYGLRPIIIRPSNPYGPRQGKIGLQGVVSTFSHKILNHETINIWGDGKTIRDFFHVKDLARLCLIAAHSDQTGIYNAGAGEGHSIMEIINIISEITGLQPKLNFLEARPFDIKSVILDISKAKKTFAWEPQIHLYTGLTSYLKWLSSIQTHSIQKSGE